MKVFRWLGDPITEEKKITFYHFPWRIFERDALKKWKTSKLLNYISYPKYLPWYARDNARIVIEKFFAPEMYYMLSQLNEWKPNPAYTKVMRQMMQFTWLGKTQTEPTERANLIKLSDMTVTLKPYQSEFIELYNAMKHKYMLNGYLLAFEQGLGKTLTSLATMHCKDKKHIFVIAPKSTLVDTWKREIDTKFKDPQTVWVVGDAPASCRWYIINYESIDKLNALIPLLTAKGVHTGIIVDEIHNFRNKDAKRVIELIDFARAIKCQDILTMSGTPIKAMGSEMIPLLKLLDPLFNETVEEQFKKALGVSVPVALDVLKNRLGMMMHRKLKSEVLDLPEKIIDDIYIKVPDGDKYTLENVKTMIKAFHAEKTKFYKENFEKYKNDYFEALKYFELKGGIPRYADDYKAYKIKVDYIRKNPGDFSPEMSATISWVNKFEKIISSFLPSEMKKRFVKAKSVYKYVDKTIMGEIIGGLLNQLRSEMCRKIMENSPLAEWVVNAEKKTVCFTTYVEVVKECDAVMRAAGMTPALAFGETSNDLPRILQQFRTDPKVNPLIATIQTLSTGVTVTEANTAIFLNKPWRAVDFWQACDRIHRIGQDTTVYIKTLILDTGDKPNLSTRMEAIVAWSTEMFQGIVGGSTVDAIELAVEESYNYKFDTQLNNPKHNVMYLGKDAPEEEHLFLDE